MGNQPKPDLGITQNSEFFFLRNTTGGGGYITEMENYYSITGFYYGLLRFITDITEFYYVYYGTFLKDFIDSEPRPQKSPRNSNI